MSAHAHPYANFVHTVEKPARYLGGEYQSVTKDWDAAACRMALCFPDVYDIGMSHLGTKILYSVVNGMEDLLLERAFCPWLDMERELRRRGLPLLSLESHRPLRDFDVVGFSLQYELTFTNILTMLDLGGIPLHNADRTAADPLVIAGGPVATQPEPLAPFIDLFLIGDAEERLPRLLRHYAEMKREGGRSRIELLAALAQEGGVYCPDLYEREVCERTGLLTVARPKDEQVPPRVRRAFLDDISRYPFPDDSPVAVAEAIFDRMSVEIARGCTEGCRFCQAGMIYRPVRERDPEEVIRTLESALAKGGYDEGALTSLSTADYSAISPLVKRVMERLRPRKVSLGISSLRAYGLDEDLLDEIASVKATGLTFAPEAGTQRLRDVVNKNISEDDIYTTCHRVFARGWSRIKLYFMIGLPTEQDEDVLGIAAMGRQAVEIGRQYGKKAQVTVSVSSHVPKPHTPFQWCAMDPPAEIERKQALLREQARRSRFVLRTHDHRTSHLEGIVSRGDRRTGWLIERAWRNGARFDGWDEHLRWDVWQEALAAYEREFGLSREVHLRTLPVDGRLPWDHIDVGLEDGFLLQEYKRSLKDRLSPPCGKPYQAKVHHTNAVDAAADTRKLVCYHCGVACDLSRMKEERIAFLHKLGAEQPPARAEEGTARDRAAGRLRRGETPHDFGQGERVRYRLRYRKLAPLHLQGHLDLVRMLPRVLRRAGLPLFYSEGFSPHPVMVFGPALALGIRSLAEYADFALTGDVPADEVFERLVAHADDGLVITGVRRLEDGEPALGKRINAVDFAAILPDPASSLEAIQAPCDAALADQSRTVTVQRKDRTRTVALRDRVRLLQVRTSDDFARTAGVSPGRLALVMRLAEGDGPSLRPAEVVQALLSVEIQPVDLLRLGCWFVDGEGVAYDPLDPRDAPSRPAGAQPLAEAATR